MTMPLALLLRRRLRSSASPLALFGFGEQGVWFDPSDLSTLFQDTAGTQPVTTTGQSVGLMLDKSKGLVLGPELVTNGDFASGTGWITTSWVISGGVATITNASDSIAQNVTFTAGKTYKVTYTLSGFSGTGAFRPRFFGGTTVTGTSVSANGTYSEYMVAVTGNTQFAIATTTATCTGSIDNISVKELPGNHAVQATTANRPIYGIHPFGGRRNLLTWTTFGGAVAGTPGTAPTDWPFNSSGGSITSISNEVIAFSATAARQIVGRVINVAANQTHIWGVTVVSNPNSLVFNQLFTLINPTGLTSFLYYANGALVDATSYAPLANDRLTVVLVNGGSASTPIFRIGVGASGVATGSASFTQPQAEVGSTATAYQRVTDQYNVTEAGVSSVSYLFFDGVNDSLATPSINFTSTDKMTVFAGVRKLVDTGYQVVVENSTNPNTTPGTFGLGCSTLNGDASRRSWATVIGGTNSGILGGAVIYAAPDTKVVSILNDISQPTSDTETVMRLNGLTQTLVFSAGDAGTGNFGNYPLFIGARNSASNFLNGHLYSLIVRGAQSNTGQISSTETWVASKTGITI